MNYKIPLSEPEIIDKDRQEVLKVLKTNFLSLGPKLEEFEKKIADFTGVKYAIALNSGTSALHLIVKALGISKGDQVITTPFSFVSSSNCILYERAEPVFVDIESDTLSINPKLIEKLITVRTKAILAVDVFGRPAEWDLLEKIAKKHNLFLIEDSAEALGSEFNGRKCGSFGDVAIFSFYPNKQITTGEGGVVLTDDKKLADLCRSMSNQGRRINSGKWLEHEILGYNYRLDEMSCSLGVSQLVRIEKIIKRRENIVKLYNQALKGFNLVETPIFEKNKKISWFVYVIKLAKNLSDKRDLIIKRMADRGIQCGNYFYPIHLQPFYRRMFDYKEGNFPIAEDIGGRTLALPFFNNLSEKEVDFIVNNLREAISNV